MSRHLRIMECAYHCGIDPQLGAIEETPPVDLTTAPPSGATPLDVLLWFKSIWGDDATVEAPAAFSGWPAAVTVRPGNWDMTTQPAKYQIAGGDTLAGLAATYLGDPARWKEIWDLQPQDFRWSHDPDKIYPGQWFLMPDEARDNLLNWIKQGKPTNTKPGELPPETLAQKGRRLALPIAIGATVCAVVYYVATR